MALQCGIVGLPNVGKSTLFNCLSNAKAQAANFPFCTIEPNVGVITVPDERLTKLAELVPPVRSVHTTVESVAIAGLVLDDRHALDRAFDVNGLRLCVADGDFVFSCLG